MNTRDNNRDDEIFDRQARQLHATAVSRLSPQTLSRLRAARQQAQQAATARDTRGHRWRWAGATAFSALLAVLVVSRFPATPPAPADDASLATLFDNGGQATDGTVLDENPDLFLWLASVEAQPIAME